MPAYSAHRIEVMGNMAKPAKLDIKAMAAAGAVIGLAYVLFMWVGWNIDWGASLAKIMAEIYVGFAPSVGGLIIGLIYGAIDVGIAAAIFAWVYNKVSA